MSECTHDCSTCGSACASRTAPQSLLAQSNPLSNVKHVIGVVSGKGGVGKSLVTALLSSGMQKKGYHAAVLDADITGPSVPQMFGVHDKAEGCEQGILPLETASGLKLMSINCLLENDTDPVVWRGSLIAGTVKQFWSDVCWGDVDFMFVDMPPGTGDVPLTVFQSLPVDAIVIVTSPQELVSMIVQKALKMAQMMDVPVLGLVENMAYTTCPCCGEKIYPFGEGRTAEVAAANGVPLLASLPINPAFAAACDKGEIEKLEIMDIQTALEVVEAIG